MTRVRARYLFGGLFVFLSILSAGAQEVSRVHRNVNVPAGREGRLGYYASPDEACGKGIAPEIAIVERPNYGRIVLRPDRLTAYSSTVPARANGCRGKFVDVISVYYKPAAGFHGSDRVVLRVLFPATAGGPASTLFEAIYISVR